MKGSPTAAHQRYRNDAGHIVPGVTTVIALLAKPALVPWAWRLGMKGEDMSKVRDRAANIGSCTHIMLEYHLKGTDPATELRYFTQDAIDVAQPLYEEFVRWLNRHPAKTLESECGVVSERWQFGGTIDWVCVPEETGLVTLRDFKTSKGIYDEYRIQMAAYKEAWNEMHPDQPIEDVEALHLDKETQRLTVHPIGVDLQTEWEMFKHLRAIYVLQKKMDPKRNNMTKRYRQTGKLGGAL